MLKRNGLRPGALLLLAVCVVLPSQADDYAVYILTGQSNSLGTSGLEGGTPADYSPGESNAYDATAFFWSNVSAANGTYPPLLYGDSAGAITTLQPQQGDAGANPTFWGPEFGFAQTLADLGHDNVLIIKASRGGGGNGFWDRATFDANNHSGHMWGHVTDTVDAALAQLAGQGHTFDVNGLMYLQGESNSGAQAAIADDRLDDFTNNLQAHINNAYDGAADGMHLVVGEIAASQATGSRQTTTTLQQQLTAGNDAYTFVGTRDLPLKSDNIHFGRDAKLEIGRRFGWAMMGVQVGDAVFSDIMGADDAVELVFEQYVPDTNGAANGTNLENAGTFTGFADGLNGQSPVGVRVEGSAGQVVFADYYSADTTSDLAAGSPTAAANSGDTLTFTFVDTNNPEIQAAVSGVAFELSATAGDNVVVRFLDRHGRVLMETGPNTDGAVAFESTNSFTGEAISLIHQVEVSGDADANTLWTLGHRTDAGGAPDFVFAGFSLLEQASGDLNGDGLVGAEDLDLLLAHWGDVGLLTETLVGDADFDGRVGQSDLDVVITQWGTDGSGTALPEPGSLVALSLLALLHSGRDRCRVQTASH
ncbi:hypothetical protein OT109_14940 [Phycisphaeraceae bacterium D3-23]